MAKISRIRGLTEGVPQAAAETARRLAGTGARFVRGGVRRTADFLRTDPTIGTLRGSWWGGWAAESQHRVDMADVRRLLRNDPDLSQHPAARHLTEVVTGPTDIGPDDHPRISKLSHGIFTGLIPHLFRDGLAILNWTQALQGRLAGLPDQLVASVGRAARVVDQMVQTAAITAPTDLWITRQLSPLFRENGLIAYLDRGEELVVSRDAHRFHGDTEGLEARLAFLHSRGYLDRTDRGFVKGASRRWDSIAALSPLVPDLHHNPAAALHAWLGGDQTAERSRWIRDWLVFHGGPSRARDWTADGPAIEMGYRAVPLVLALCRPGVLGSSKAGDLFEPLVPLPDTIPIFLEAAGCLESGRFTSLGSRVFRKAPGPFGIIHAYRDLSRVSRSEDITASALAHLKFAQGAVTSLDRFSKGWKWNYRHLIEHAFGLGPATREHARRHAGESFNYVGADLEAESLELAAAEQRAGRLPASLRFVASDIGDLAPLLESVGLERIQSEGAVFIVNAGFEEIRDRSGATLRGSLARLAAAEAVLITGETPLLTDQELLGSAWQTMHAGFRLVHRRSGQVLRPDEEWRQIFDEAGFLVSDDYSIMGRPIFPYPRPAGQNPPVSATYFCVPKTLAARLRLV